MMRNLIVLICAGLLAVGLSFSSFAGSVVDADSDGIPDQYDNCTGLANGPLAPAAVPDCDSQLDSDLDGYGNACDTDSTQDGSTLADDLSDVLLNFGATGNVPQDHTCDGAVLANDLSRVLLTFGASPGPSGLACADPTGATAPCVAE